MNESGKPQRFKVNSEGLFELKNGKFTKDGNHSSEKLNITSDDLIVDDEGAYFRNWRHHINSPDDIWTEIVEATKLPGITSAPKLQPIETRLVMLQTGMRAPMGIKVKGNDLKTIEAFGVQLEEILKNTKGNFWIIQSAY